MKMLLLNTLILLLTIQNSLGQINSEIESKVDSYLEPYLDMNAWSGVILISKSGVPVFEKAYGLADREWELPNTIDAKFRIASISKVFTEVAILMLSEKNRISLDDSLSKYISDYPRGDEIMIRQLIEHRSGIPHLNSFPNYGDLIKNEYQIDEIIQLFKNKPLDFEPGERYSYSNSGYVLLACIIEQVSGLTYEEFLKKEIFTKINLEHTGVDRADKIIENRAKGYMFDNTGSLVNAEYVNMSIKIGGGSLYSTAKDLNHFVHQLLGKVIISSSLGSLPNFGESYGEEVFTANGRVQGFCHQITHRLESDITVIVLGNHYSNIALPISEDIFRIYSGQPYEIPKNFLADEIILSKSALQKYEGTYDFGFGPIGEVKVVESDLTYLAPGRILPDKLVPIGNHTFFYPQSWVLLSFRDEEGEKFKTLDWIMGENNYPAERIK